jgi:ABC-type sugar transport system ATPase subunit
MTSLVIEALAKSFGAVDVLQDINLRVESGEFTVFVGPSGCGKSTLLRMICGLDEATSGRILIDNTIMNDVPPSKRGIAMVFQSYALYPHMTVAENMGYSLRLAGEAKCEITTRVEKAAAILKISDYLHRKPRQLSGGQRQRVAIGRAIVREPKIFLFDEPLSNLDAALRVDMRMEFARLKQRLGTTMIYVTHDQVEAMTLADKIVVMNGGRIEQVGSPLDLYASPINRFVAGFIGSPRMNFLPVLRAEPGRLVLPGGTVDIEGRGAAELGIRPEHMTIAETGQIAGTVLAAEHLGSDTFAYVEVAGTERPLMVRLSGDTRVESGAAVRIAVDLSHCHLFDAAGLTMPRASTTLSGAA